VLHTDAFHIYFPKGSDSFCSFIARELPSSMELIKRRMLSSLDKTPNVIVYPAADQLYETNIGGSEPVSYTLPTVVLKGNRMVVAYNGSYQQLKEDLREAITRAIWEEQFKTDLEAQLKGAAIDEKLPFWFSEGMINYFAHGWTISDEDRLNSSFSEKQFTDWQAVIANQPAIAGKALCYYLSRSYFRQAPMQLFLQLKKKRSLPRAIRLIAKESLDSVYAGCLAFYQQRFTPAQPADSAKQQQTIVIPHKKGKVLDLKLNKDHSYCLYTVAGFHRRTVYAADLKTGTSKKIATYLLPPWISDHATDPYPLTAWAEDSRTILTGLPQKGKLRILKYNTDSRQLQENVLYGVDGITTLKNNKAESLLLAAFRKGQSDIVGYDLRRERYTAYTDDVFDDYDPDIDAKGNLVFASDRTIKKDNITTDKDSLLQVQGIFTGKDKQPLVYDTLPYIRWNKPEQTDNGVLAATTKAGTERFSLIKKDRTIQSLGSYHPYQLSNNNQTISFFSSNKDSIYISSYPTADWMQYRQQKPTDTLAPWLKDYLADATERRKEDSILKAAKYEGPSFLEGVLTPKNSRERAQQRKDSVLQSLQYDPKKISPYILQLHSAYFTARVNNDYFINRYQPYLNYQGQFKFPEPGGMAKGGFTDLFENHHFSMAYRMPAGTEGSDFFVRYENTARKTDWSLLWFRKVETLKPDPNRQWKDENGNPYPNNARVKTNYYEASVTHPLSYYLNIGFTTAIRHDRTIFLATEKYTLHFDDVNSTWSISTLSSNYDKLRPTIPNLYQGFKGRVALDVFQGFSQARDGLYGISADLQYHQPIYKFITAVGRLQAGTSGGSSRLLYNMGGVDNNLTIRTDSTVHFAQDAPYAFQTLITPLRGYLQNEIYGNQFALLNADVYFPLFETLVPIETPLSFINNLQPGVFTDFAFAKESWQPGAQTKSLWSYGLSARTTLAGYPLRFDIAWPGTFKEQPIWYLSLSLR